MDRFPESQKSPLQENWLESQIDAELFGYAIQNQEAKSGYPNSSPLNYEPEWLTTIGKNERFATRKYRDFRGHYESLVWFRERNQANLDFLIYQFREPGNAAHDLHPGPSATNEGTRATTQSLMSLMTKKTRIDAKRVAEIIGCSRKTVLNGGAGTAQLTRIRNGSTQVRFILEEVLAFAEKQERDAQRRLPKGHSTMTS